VLAVERGSYSDLALDPSSLDLEEIGNALADQANCQHRWLINPQTGEIAFWTADTGIDGQTPVDPVQLRATRLPPLQDRELVAQDQDLGGLPRLLAPG
jgi:hypothetical protein